MAGAIAALAVRPAGGGAEPVRIEDWDCVSTSYPGFLDDLAEVAGGAGAAEGLGL